MRLCLWFALVDRFGVFRCLISQKLSHLLFGLDVIFVCRFRSLVSFDQFLHYFQTCLPSLLNVFKDPLRVLLLFFDPALQRQKLSFGRQQGCLLVIHGPQFCLNAVTIDEHPVLFQHGYVILLSISTWCVSVQPSLSTSCSPTSVCSRDESPSEAQQLERGLFLTTVFPFLVHPGWHEVGRRDVGTRVGPPTSLARRWSPIRLVHIFHHSD